MGELRTERLTLREWRPQDREPFAAMNADPTVMEFFVDPLTREQSDAFVDRIEAHFAEHGWGLWVMEVEGEFAGFTGLQWTSGLPVDPAVEIGWRVPTQFWGHGYATEAASAALAFGLTQVDTIVSVTAVSNVRSQRVMERIGLQASGLFDHPRVPEGHVLRPHVLYTTV